MNEGGRSVVSRRLLELDAASDRHQEVLHLAVLRLLQEFGEAAALPLGRPPAWLRRRGGGVGSFIRRGLPGNGLRRQRLAAAGGQRGARRTQQGPWCTTCLGTGSGGEPGVIRHSGGLDRDHRGFYGNGAEVEAPRGSPQVGFGGGSSPNGGDARGGDGRRVGGEAGGGRRTFGLEQPAVRLSDVAVPGDGEGLIEV